MGKTKSGVIIMREIGDEKEKLEFLQKEMSKQAFGKEIHKSDVIRYAIDKLYDEFINKNK